MFFRSCSVLRVVPVLARKLELWVLKGAFNLCSSASGYKPMLGRARVVIILLIAPQWEASPLASYNVFKSGFIQSVWHSAHAVQPRIRENTQVMIGGWVFPWFMQKDRNCCVRSNKWLVKSVTLLPAMSSSRCLKEIHTKKNTTFVFLQPQSILYSSVTFPPCPFSARSVIQMLKAV